MTALIPLVGSGTAEKVCGQERTREGATMGNFNFLVLWRLLDVWHPLIIPNSHLIPSYMHKGATFMYPMYDLDGSIKP